MTRSNAGKSRTRRRAGAVLAVVLLGTAACGGEIVELEPSGCDALSEDGSLSLAPGESCVFAEGARESLQFAASDGIREYAVAVQSASPSAAVTSLLRVRVRGPEAAPSTGPWQVRGPDPSAASRALERSSRAELALRRNALSELRRTGARPLRAGPVSRAAPGFARSVAGFALAPGDTLRLRNSVLPNLAVDCSSEETVTAVVRASGDHFALAEDTAVSGGFSQADYDFLLAELEEFVYPISEAYFGAPADLDGNGRVVTLITPVVNGLLPGAIGTFIAGFFNPSDLTENCEASNRGEILYVLAPDPDGTFGEPRSIEFARDNLRSVAAHELQHLISAERRVTLGGGSLFFDLEDAWLGEGLSHIAETAIGLARDGLGTRQNLDFAAVNADPSTFAAYHRTNFNRLGHHLRDPDGTPALGDVEGADPGGVSSLEMRGFAWNLLRWVADHLAPASPEGPVPGSGEDRLFRELAKGGPELLTGVENLARALQVVGAPERSWPELLAGYGLSPLLDDAGQPQLPGETQMPTWHLRDVFSNLHAAFPDQNPFREEYPLQVTHIPLTPSTDRTVDFQLRASAAHYLELVSADAHPEIALEVTLMSGGNLPDHVQLLVARRR